MGTRDEMLKAQLEGESNKAELDNRQSGLGCQLELLEEYFQSPTNLLMEALRLREWSFPSSSRAFSGTVICSWGMSPYSFWA